MLFLFLAVLAVIGAVLMLFGSTGSKESGQKEEAVSYYSDFEHKIKQMITALTKDDDPQLFVTYSNADAKTVSVFTADNSTNSDIPQGTVEGIAVICHNGEDTGVQRNLICLIRSALGVGANRIYIGGKPS